MDPARSPSINPIDPILRVWTRFAEFVSRHPATVIVLPLGLMVLSIAVSSGGQRHPEAELYIPHYLSHQTILEKVYDYKHTDMPPVYRPRPLSNLVDIGNVAFLAWSYLHGFPNFLALSNFVFLTLDCLALWFFCRRCLLLDVPTSGLIAGLLAANQVVMTNIWLFHAGNAGASFFLLLGFVALSLIFRTGKNYVPLGLLACLSLFSACLFHEIAAGFLLAAPIVLALEWRFAERGNTRSPALRTAILSILGALVLFLVYDFQIHMRMIELATGEKLAPAYQTGVLQLLREHFVAHLFAAATLFLDAFSYAIGGIPIFLALVALVAILCFWFGTLKGPIAVRCLRIGIAPALLLGCLLVMISRHTPIAHMVYTATNYLYTFEVLGVVFVACSAALLLKSKPRARTWVQLSLALMILSGATTSAIHEASRGHDDPVWEVSGRMLKVLRSNAPIREDQLTDPVEGAYYRQIQESKVYQSLLELKQRH